MAYKLFLSDALHVANDKLIEELKKNRTSGDKTQIIIVPDRFTLSAEQDVLKALDIKGAFDISCTSFRRLATYVLGKNAKKILSAEGAVMLLTKVIKEKAPQLKFYQKSVNYGGFASELYAVITEIRNNLYSVEDLREATPRLPEYVRQKCEDVLCVYEGYLQELSRGYTDGSTLLQELNQQIPESDYIANADVYVFDFFSFTAEQRRVIETLIKRARSVNIALVYGVGHKNERIFPIKEYLRLKELGKSARIKAEEIFIPSNMTENRKRVSNELFSYEKKERTTGGRGITIYEGSEKEEEILLVARTIKNLIREGYRYRDLAILSGDIEGTLPYFRRIFTKHGIPYFADEKTILTNTSLAIFLREALSCDGKKITQTSALELLKSPFSGFDEESVKSFYDYVIKYSINFIPLTNSFKIATEDKTYYRAEKVRREISSLLCQIDKENSAQNHAQKVCDFLENLKIQEKIESLGREQERIGDVYARSCTEQSYKKTVDVLEQIKSVMGETVLTKEEFISILFEGLEAIEIAYVPMFSDVVYIGRASESRFTECKVLFISSAQSGKLPTSNQREGIFGTREEVALKNANIDLSPTAVEASLEEKLHVLSLLLMPKDKLFLSFTAQNGDNGSELVQNIKEMFSDVTYLSYRDVFEVEESQEGITKALDFLTADEKTIKNALSQYEPKSLMGRYLSEIYGEEIKESEKRTVMDVERGRELFFPWGTTSVSQLEKFFTCPYRHFIESGLGARKVQKADSVMLAGSFIHRVLELGVSKLIADKNFEELGESEVQTIIDQVVGEEEFAPYLADNAKTTLYRLKKEGKKALKEVTKRIQNSEYKPVVVEFDFKKQTRKFQIKGKTAELNLNGKIDRVDLAEGGRVILIDYKTGKLTSGVKDTYYGLHIQLLLYLCAVESIAKKKGTGVFYYPIHSGYIKISEKKERLKGQILESEIEAFDGLNEYKGEIKGSEEIKESDYLNISYNKNGTFKKDTAEMICSPSELNALKEYVQRISANAVDEMCEGFIAPAPINKKACEYCDYAVLCATRKVFMREQKRVDKKGVTSIFGEVEDEQ